MHRRPTHPRLVPLVAIGAGLLMAVPVLASHVEPEVVDGSSSCGPLTPGTVELVIEVPQGLEETVGDDDFNVDVSLDGSVGEGSLDFTNATLPVKSAFVAGAQSGHLYVYEEPVTEDDGLVAPDDQPITNVSFCYVSGAGGGEETQAPETPAPQTQAPADTSGSGAGDGATPPSTDTALPAASPLPAVALVAAGVGLVAVGLVLLLPRRRRA